jgi:hypothetical protein
MAALASRGKTRIMNRVPALIARFLRQREQQQVARAVAVDLVTFRHGVAFDPTDPRGRPRVVVADEDVVAVAVDASTALLALPIALLLGAAVAFANG